MEASAGAPRIVTPRFEPDTEKIKLRLLKKGVNPTPKIIHTLRKKGNPESHTQGEQSRNSRPAHRLGEACHSGG
ncbi:unnamed protein product [Rhodiola kirilowii]